MGERVRRCRCTLRRLRELLGWSGQCEVFMVYPCVCSDFDSRATNTLCCHELFQVAPRGPVVAQRKRSSSLASVVLCAEAMPKTLRLLVWSLLCQRIARAYMRW